MQPSDLEAVNASLNYAHNPRRVSGSERDHRVILQNGLTLAVMLVERIKVAISRIEESPPTWASRLYPTQWISPQARASPNAYGGYDLARPIIAVPHPYAPATPAHPPAHVPVSDTCKNTAICDGVYVRAVHVPNFSDVKDNGTLYYVTSHHTFAIFIAGKMFHGNVGEIGGGRAMRTAACKYGANCTKRLTCEWYHDPLVCGGSERRDYTAASWVYAGRRLGTQPLGGRGTLCEDIARLGEQRRATVTQDYMSQTMHSILISLALTGSDPAATTVEKYAS